MVAFPNCKSFTGWNVFSSKSCILSSAAYPVKIFWLLNDELLPSKLAPSLRLCSPFFYLGEKMLFYKHSTLSVLGVKPKYEHEISVLILPFLLCEIIFFSTVTPFVVNSHLKWGHKLATLLPSPLFNELTKHSHNFP